MDKVDQLVKLLGNGENDEELRRALTEFSDSIVARAKAANRPASVINRMNRTGK